jgi:hypothetical protein
MCCNSKNTRGDGRNWNNDCPLLLHKSGSWKRMWGITTNLRQWCNRLKPSASVCSKDGSRATFEQKRQLIELLIDRVVVTGEEVEIRYAIPTSPKGEYVRFCHLRLDYFSTPRLSQSDQHHQTIELHVDGSAPCAPFFPSCEHR